MKTADASPDRGPTGLARRQVTAEILDDLPPDDPRAQHSRRDLQRLNRIMGHARFLGRCLNSGLPGADRIQLAEIGAGDGTFLLEVVRRVQGRGDIWLIDRQSLLTDRTRSTFAALGWTVHAVTADIFDWLLEPVAKPFHAITANLFLHHFADEFLQSLLAGCAARTSLFAACEPARAPLALGAARCLGWIGCNTVTRHDAVVSVRAGFRGCELSSLWPSNSRWMLDERSAGLFSHGFVARRKSG